MAKFTLSEVPKRLEMKMGHLPSSSTLKARYSSGNQQRPSSSDLATKRSKDSQIPNVDHVLLETIIELAMQ